MRKPRTKISLKRISQSDRGPSLTETMRPFIEEILAQRDTQRRVAAVWKRYGLKKVITTPDEILCDPRIDGWRTKMLANLSKRTYGNLPACWHGTERLANEMGVSEDSIERWTTGLDKEDGVILKRRIFLGRKGSRNAYILLWRVIPRGHKV